MDNIIRRTSISNIIRPLIQWFWTWIVFEMMNIERKTICQILQDWMFSIHWPSSFLKSYRLQQDIQKNMEQALITQKYTHKLFITPSLGKIYSKRVVQCNNIQLNIYQPICDENSISQIVLLLLLTCSETKRNHFIIPDK